MLKPENWFYTASEVQTGKYRYRTVDNDDNPVMGGKLYVRHYWIPNYVDVDELKNYGLKQTDQLRH